MREIWDINSKEEFEIINKKRGVAKLGFTVLFKFFQLNSRYPENMSEIPQAMIKDLSQRYCQMLWMRI
jgi:hypothetical protein